MDHFILQNTNFVFTLEPIEIKQNTGFAEITGCCFKYINYSSRYSVFLMEFDRGCLVFDNSIIKRCSSSFASQTFEFIANSENSYSILNRISICLSGRHGLPDFAHTAVCRSTTILSHTNSSCNIACHESGMYITNDQSYNVIKFLHIESCIADKHAAISVYATQTNCSYMCISNCSALNNSVGYIWGSSGRVFIENSNFFNNIGKYLFYSNDYVILVKLSNIEGLNYSNIDIEYISSVANKNLIYVANPVLQCKGSKHNKLYKMQKNILLFSITLSSGTQKYTRSGFKCSKILKS